MWAGLLASSCSDDGKDESNLLFTNLLSQLTVCEVRMVNHASKTAPKVKLETHGLIATQGRLKMSAEELIQVSGVADVHQLDRELDHLRSLGLIHEGFSGYDSRADITPTALALNLYVRCVGSKLPPTAYFGVDGAPVDASAPTGDRSAS